eukprot:CAMPEP_0113724944 /NCGR_PEP_ID=MMETSP0038_2-20120614/39413_1 /TAXON_ID=2898 /ORGANISM="Cryptomonas paramecium" /LENGTH=60 /DNA_ID=CAMNT_0000655007 /DNA_START=131 /DNA_END=309 /DNA_ORIENTATION=- /assembly_acc=CAM_ASM_000170
MKARQQPQQRRLACSVGPRDEEVLPRPHAQAEGRDQRPPVGSPHGHVLQHQLPSPAHQQP